MFSDDQEGPKELSTRVNSARLPDYVGRSVRLACKVLKLDANAMVVEASDGGQVNIVSILPNIDLKDPYIEIVGKVVNPTSMNMYACVNLGNDLDMKLVNDTIELIHDNRFFQRMFC